MRFTPQILLVLLCVVMISLVWTGGPNYSFDDYNYVLYAKQILNHTFSYNESAYAYGYLLPTTVADSYKLFGVSNLAASIPAMLEYIILILLIYSISKKLSNTKIAFSVGVIAATSAFICAYSSRVLPDMLVGDIVALAVWCIICNDDVPSVSAIIAGMIMGLLIFVKLGALGIVLPIALVLFLSKQRINSLVYLVGVAIMVCIYLVSVGNNLSIFHSYQANQISLDNTDLEINALTTLVYIFPVLFFLQKGAYWQIFPLTMLFDYALIGGYISFLKKESQYLPWLIALVLSFLYLQFGSESLTSYIPITVVSRYFIILSPIMAILTTRFLQGVFDFIRYKWSLNKANIVLVSLVLISIIVNIPMIYYFHLGAPHFNGAPIP